VDFVLFRDGRDHLVALHEAFEAGGAASGFLGALTGLEAADELLLLFDVGLLLFELALLGEFFELFLPDEGGVVAFVGFEATVGQPDDAGGEAVEEEAVVADQEDGAGEVEEVSFEPLDGGEVEVVGGLVEEEQIGLGDEQLGKREARALAAGEGGDVLLPDLFFEADAMEGGFELVSPGVASGKVEFLLELVVFFEDLFERVTGEVGHFVFEVAEAVGEVVEGGEGELGLVDDGVGGVEDGVLAEVTDLDRFIHGGGTGVEGELAEEGFEEGGFARAVVADEADALAAVDVEIELVEEDALAEGFFDVGEGGDGHRLLECTSGMLCGLSSACSLK
jgi:hypothetical protein